MAALRVNSLKTVLAKCMPSDLKNIAKFQVKKMEFDQNLNMVRLGLLLLLSRIWCTKLNNIYINLAFCETWDCVCLQ